MHIAIDAVPISNSSAGISNYSFNMVKSLAEFDKKIAAFRELQAAQQKATSVAGSIGATPNAQQNAEVRATYTEMEIKVKMHEIEEKAILTRQDALKTVKEELALLGDGITADGKNLLSQVEALNLKKDKLEVERELARLNENNTIIAAQMKANGASELQLSIQKLAYLQAINATQDEINKQQTVVQVTSINQYKSVQDDIINALLSEQKTIGETNLAEIQHKIILEDKLGIHLQGVDLLKQQLELYKAIATESTKTPQQRQKELLDLIKKTPTPEKTGFVTTFRNEQEESRLTKEALLKGISRDVIDSILNPNLKSKSGGINSLQDELKRGLTDPLTTNIANLSHTISRLAEAITRPHTGPDVGSNLHFNNPEGLPITSNQALQNYWGDRNAQHQSTKGSTIGVNLGGINVVVNAHTKSELNSKLTQIMHELIAEQMIKPDSKMNKAIKDVVEKF